MATINKFKDFNAFAVPLEGSNLIEASAGTGKTYSIAILVLRLLLEKQLSVKEILMVTFTRAAVAELQERIRLFVRSAYQFSNGDIIEDKTIMALVSQAVKSSGNNEVSRLLRDAITYLDETAVLTIHSFCQQTLSEFAFETNQLFGAELIQDTAAIIEIEVNKFWRKHITSIPVKLLTYFETGLNRNDINKIVKDHLDGKPYNQYTIGEKYILDENYHIAITNEINRLTDKYKELREGVVQYIMTNREALRKKCQGNAYVKKNLLPLVDQPEAFLTCIAEKRELVNVRDIFADLITMIHVYDQITVDIGETVQTCLDNIYYAAVNEISAGVKAFKLSSNQLSFDDLITNLHTALVKKDNPVLVAALRNKYKAVFIDEFQDTDRLQYEIFNKAFGKDTVLFYIGDPKQSIYAWRKADINTYFTAFDTASKRYGMNENYRSTESFIKAMNLFFQPEPGFDTFHFPKKDHSKNEHAIDYIPVNSPAENTKGKLNFNDKEIIPISVSTQSNKASINAAVTAQVIDLLSNKGYTILKDDKIRSIQPSDIGILVRSNKEGNDIKNGLAGYGIPAVTIGDAKVLESAEAVELLYLLEAMINITRSNINRALLCSLTGFGTNSILSLNDEAAIELFKKYKTNWDANGIYATLINFIADFGVPDRFLNNTENGERVITNLYQLVELLHKAQTTKNLSPLELIDWLKRGIESNDGEGDEYEQRIENDEECIKIVTIHKSKGLEYNIVIAPFLDFAERKKDVFCNYRNASGEYINIKKDKLTPALKIIFEEQTEQENRRLLYVAITRAVYKCFIYKNNHYKKSTLSFFTNALTKTDPSLIEELTAPQIPTDYYFKTNEPTKKDLTETIVNFNLRHTNWTRMSYSGLAAEMEKHSKISTGNPKDEYDRFIFSQLIKGNKTGNMLHYIFENLHFTNNSKWTAVIDTAIKRFSPAQKALYEPGLAEMLQHVLNARIQAEAISFNLTEVGFDQRIHEFEFDFPVNLFQPAGLKKLSNDKIRINIKSRPEFEGIMNGKIDMLFECRDKYFVLDWKSTFLGDSLQQYAPAALDEAMNESNYHLQYLIYTLATIKYLKNRLPGFDYEKDFGGVLYLFVRGMRKGTGNGIFICKPSLKQVEELEQILHDSGMSDVHGPTIFKKMEPELSTIGITG
ncbi:MAG: exodeoxyribonuclease V subunit beta [Ferruginibacter sp.]|nr:exodeoxyribonuclease V subunit beta [Ferruginibacter sp.]